MPRKRDWKRDRDRLADANQQERELKNRIHAYEQETVLPLRARIAELERDNTRLKRTTERLERLERLYRDAWVSGIRLAGALLATGKGDE